MGFSHYTDIKKNLGFHLFSYFVVAFEPITFASLLSFVKISCCSCASNLSRPAQPVGDPITLLHLSLLRSVTAERHKNTSPLCCAYTLCLSLSFSCFSFLSETAANHYIAEVTV